MVTNAGTIGTVTDGDGGDSNDATRSGLTLVNTGTVDVAARGVNVDNRTADRVARGPAAIPVPAAVWMAGSSLAALAGLRLRRRARLS